MIDLSLYIKSLDFESCLSNEIKEEDFPLGVSLDFPEYEGIEIGIDQFQNVSKFCNYVADESRSSMCGVYFSAENSEIVATNAHVFMSEKADVSESFLLPKKSCFIIDSLPNKTKAILYKKKGCFEYLEIIGDEYSFKTKLNQDAYPPYKSMIPNTNTYRKIELTRANIKEVIKAIELLKSFVNKKTNHIILEGSEIFVFFESGKKISIKFDFEIVPDDFLSTYNVMQDKTHHYIGFDYKNLVLVLKESLKIKDDMNVYYGEKDINPVIIENSKNKLLSMPLVGFGERESFVEAITEYIQIKKTEETTLKNYF
jgi:hypothetical protein